MQLTSQDLHYMLSPLCPIDGEPVKSGSPHKDDAATEAEGFGDSARQLASGSPFVVLGGPGTTPAIRRQSVGLPRVLTPCPMG